MSSCDPLLGGCNRQVYGLILRRAIHEQLAFFFHLPVITHNSKPRGTPAETCLEPSHKNPLASGKSRRWSQKRRKKSHMQLFQFVNSLDRQRRRKEEEEEEEEVTVGTGRPHAALPGAATLFCPRAL